MKRTPVEFSTLKASHETSKPERQGNMISVTISVGGPSAPYAVYVHEMVDNFHKIGQAKFLESTILESAPHIPSRVARRAHLDALTGWLNG